MTPIAWSIVITWPAVVASTVVVMTLSRHDQEHDDGWKELDTAVEESRINLDTAWTELRGYVAEAAVDGEPFEALRMLRVMDELRRSARKPLTNYFAALQPRSNSDDES